MYEEEVLKNEQKTKEIENLKLTVKTLEYELKRANSKIEKEVKKAVAKAIKSYETKIDELEKKLEKALQEIKRLKNTANATDESKDYTIDKLTSQLNKNSTNSSIPTSKESITESVKRRTNEYNHRTASTKKSGGQVNHPGKTLTKEQIEELIKSGKVEVKVIEKYIDGSKYKNEITKYRIGIKTITYVEEYHFKPSVLSNEKLPKEFYSDVTYNNDIKSLVVLLGNYFYIPYNKVSECISNLTDNIVKMSEGTIDNIYEEFSNKTTNTLENIKNNLLNGSYQHTDETVTRESGKDKYYRGYANIENVLFKYHSQKGDKPIIEDNILPLFLGILISDHENGIFKYGSGNQDCIVHFGRYCIEQNENTITLWQMQMYRLLLKCKRNRDILKNYGKTCFDEEEIQVIYDDYDAIVKLAEEENKFIPSKFWRKEANKLLKRCIKHKEHLLCYIHDFNIPSDNNFMERALRAVKGKTKVSGGFRSEKGGKRFGNAMSIIKTSKLRKIVPFKAITTIMGGEELFVS